MQAAFLVVRINLNDHTSILQCIKANDINYFMSHLENVDEERRRNGKELIDLIACLENVTLKNETFEEKLFKHYFKNGRLVIMFDGYDEIDDDLKPKVLYLIHKFKSSTNHIICITSRPIFKEHLEITFGTFAFMLRPFCDDDILQFLKRYWNTAYFKMIDLTWNCNFQTTANVEEKINIYAIEFLTIYKDYIHEKNWSFLGIPLQLEMLAEIYKRKWKDDDKWEGCFDYINNASDKNPILPTAINLFELYEKFVEIKILDKHYYDKTGMQRGNSTGKKMIEKEFKNAIHYHQLFALDLLITDKKFKHELLDSKQNDLKDWSEKIINKEEDVGIITYIVNGKPHFIHLTFAEYFAAVYLSKNCFHTLDKFFLYVNDICANSSVVFIFCIIELLKNEKEFEDSLDAKNLLTYSAEKGYLNIVKLLTQENIISDCDNNGKTAMHYAAANNRKYIADFLLKFYNDIRKKNILRNGTFKKPEYAFSKLVSYINKKDNMQKTALYYAILHKNWDIAEQLALKGDTSELSGETIMEFSKHIIGKVTITLTSDEFWNIAKPLFSENETFYLPSRGNVRTFVPDKHYLYPILEKAVQNFDITELPSDEFIRLIAILWYLGRLQLIKNIENKVKNEDTRQSIFKSKDRKEYPLDRINKSPYISDEERLELIKYLFEHGGTSISKLSSANLMSNSPKNPHFIALLNSAIEHGATETFKHYFHEKNDLADHFSNYALSYDRQEIVSYLSRNWNQEINHYTPLHIAMFNDSIGVKGLDDIYKETPHFLDTKNGKGRTPLFMAIDAPHGLAKIKYLVEKDVNVIIQHKQDIIKALNENLYIVEDDVLEYLLKMIGCDLNQTLHQVMKSEIQLYNSNKALMIYLIKHGADVNERDHLNKLPIYYASEANLNDVINVLLQHGSKYEDQHEEIYFDTLSTIKRTFENIRSFYSVLHMEFINAKNDDEKTLLHIALEESSNKALDDVLKAHVDHLNSRNYGTIKYRFYTFTSLNAKDKSGKTPLIIAMEKENYYAIKRLVQCGVIFDTENYPSTDENILQLINDVTTLFNNLESMNETFDIPSDFKDVRNQQGETPLHCAIKSNKKGVLLKLIKMIAYIEAQNNDDRTPLYLAAEVNNLEAVQILLLHGAFLNTNRIFDAPKNDSEIFLNEIVKIFDTIKGKRPEDIVDILNKKSKKEILVMVNACDEHGHSLLYYAALWNYSDIIKYLLNKGSDVNNVTKMDRVTENFSSVNQKLFKKISKLFEDSITFVENVNDLKAEHGLEEIIILNIRKNVDHEGVSYRGSTLLHAAVYSMQIDVIKWLLSHGADINAQDFTGNTVKQLKNYHEDIGIKTCIDRFSV